MKLQIAKHMKFMGPGCYELLALIRQCGSVRVACERMGLSYSKAWRILNALEEETGVEVLERRQGGKSGGESRLSQAGEDLMTRYAAFEAECKEAVEHIFARHFAREAGSKP